jgi:hypothetical protein
MDLGLWKTIKPKVLEKIREQYIFVKIHSSDVDLASTPNALIIW